MGLLTDLTAIADSILGIRDTIGAVIEPVYIVVRTWTGAQPGDGTSSDVTTQLLPSPQLANLVNTSKPGSAGTVENASIMLKGISKQSYATKDTVDLTSTLANVEKFYKLRGRLYNVTSVEESYITWNVRIKEAEHIG